MTLQQKLTKAIFEYDLIQDGDKVLIGLSGGKDSLALVELIGERMKIFHPRFSALAVHVTVEGISYESDLDYLRAHCDQHGIAFVHEHRSIEFDPEGEKSPCFLCSWNRRKGLFDVAKAHGCNKIAFGHHQDDIIETLMMNVTFQGAFSTMPPKLKMSKFDMTIIRPMCLISEQELIALQEERGYKKQIKNCPYEHASNRAKMREIMSRLETMNPLVRKSIWGSMTNIQPEYLPAKPIKRR